MVLTYSHIIPVQPPQSGDLTKKKRGDYWILLYLRLWTAHHSAINNSPTPYDCIHFTHAGLYITT